MNEEEKKAFEILGEEAKEKIAGGVNEDEDLTNDQCAKLKEAISQLSEDEQLKIAGGKNVVNIKPHRIPPAMFYGGKPGIHDRDLWKKINEKSGNQKPKNLQD